jgi:hypothetical protein
MNKQFLCKYVGTYKNNIDVLDASNPFILDVET